MMAHHGGLCAWGTSANKAIAPVTKNGSVSARMMPFIDFVLQFRGLRAARAKLLGKAGGNGATTNIIGTSKTVRTLSRRSLYSFCNSSSRYLLIVVIAFTSGLDVCQRSVPAVQRYAALPHQILQSLAGEADRANFAVVPLARRDFLQFVFDNFIDLSLDSRQFCFGLSPIDFFDQGIKPHRGLVRFDGILCHEFPDPRQDRHKGAKQQ